MSATLQARRRRVGALLTGLLITAGLLLKLDMDAQLGVNLAEVVCEDQPGQAHQIRARNYDGVGVFYPCGHGRTLVTKLYDQGGFAGIISGHSWGLRAMGSRFQQSAVAGEYDLIAGAKVPALGFVSGRTPAFVFQVGPDETFVTSPAPQDSRDAQ